MSTFKGPFLPAFGPSMQPGMKGAIIGGGADAPEFSPKSIVFEISDDHGGASANLSVWRIEFVSRGEVLAAEVLGYSAYATSTFPGYNPATAFNTSAPKTGGPTIDRCWISNGQNTNQRLSIVWSGPPPTWDEIRINNYHNAGAATDEGIKNTAIIISDDAITDNTFNQIIPGSTVIFNGEIREHIASDAADDNSLSLFDGGGAVLAKSFVLDVADNWGAANYLALRSIEFVDIGGEVIPLTDADFTAYATTYFNSTYHPKKVFDTSLSKVGSMSVGSWYSANGGDTNQRIIVVFNSLQLLNGVIVNNSHSSGGGTNYGIKNTAMIISGNAITDTTPKAEIANSMVLFAGEVREHIASNVADDNNISMLREGAITFGMVFAFGSYHGFYEESHGTATPATVYGETLTSARTPDGNDVCDFAFNGGLQISSVSEIKIIINGATYTLPYSSWSYAITDAALSAVLAAADGTDLDVYYYDWR